jgi:hypothetical protein
VIAEVAPIAAEQLVAADAGQDDGDVATRKLRHQERGDERGIRDRLVEMPNELRQERADVRLDDDLVVIRAE